MNPATIESVSSGVLPSSRIGEVAASELFGVWPALLAGKQRIVASGSTAHHHYLRLAPVAGPGASGPVDEVQRGRIERVLLGDPQKAVACETGCSVSTVATQVSTWLRAWGLEHGSSRVPALLVWLLHALRGGSSLALWLERGSELGDGLAVRTARVELTLVRDLSPSELAVAVAMVEGKTHLQIAAERATSLRTVANQVATVYRKLGVSGRLELLAYLARVSAAARP